MVGGGVAVVRTNVGDGLGVGVEVGNVLGAGVNPGGAAGRAVRVAVGVGLVAATRVGPGVSGALGVCLELGVGSVRTHADITNIVTARISEQHDNPLTTPIISCRR